MECLLAARAWLETLDAFFELLGELLGLGTRPALLTAPYQRPLLVHHDASIRFGEFLNPTSLRLRKLSGLSVDVLQVVGFDFDRPLGLAERVRHQEERKASDTPNIT